MTGILIEGRKREKQRREYDGFSVGKTLAAVRQIRQGARVPPIDMCDVIRLRTNDRQLKVLLPPASHYSTVYPTPGASLFHFECFVLDRFRSGSCLVGPFFVRLCSVFFRLVPFRFRFGSFPLRFSPAVFGFLYPASFFYSGRFRLYCFGFRFQVRLIAFVFSLRFVSFRFVSFRFVSFRSVVSFRFIAAVQ